MPHEAFSRRREQLLDAMGPGVALFPAAPVAVRNNDVDHEYRQSSDLFYLCGFDEPECVLLLTNCHPEHKTVLFVRPRDPAREVWDGARAGVEGAMQRFGADAAYPISEFFAKLPDYLGRAPKLVCRLGDDEVFDRNLIRVLSRLRSRSRAGAKAPELLADPAPIVHEMRLRKDPSELDTMRRAAAITHDAHLAAMRVAAPGRFEYEVEAELLRSFRAAGSERAAYGSIVGSGPNATVLHYRRNDRQMQDGDLLLIDAGAELGYYASDVTRTFPVNGRFTAEQRAVYDIVLSAQKAAVDTIKPGATLTEVHDRAVAVTVDGLIDLGWIDASAEEAIDKGLYKSYFMHKTSHWIGMDVHDVGAYLVDDVPRPFEPGFVLTVEPGIYVSPQDQSVDERWRGIGIRIEDDILVNATGHENLTAAIPKEASELESIVAEAS